MTVTACLRAIRVRIQAASAMATAALACAEEGSEHHATRIALDLEEPVQEANALLQAANALLQAACLIQRLREEGEAAAAPD